MPTVTSKHHQSNGKSAINGGVNVNVNNNNVSNTNLMISSSSSSSNSSTFSDNERPLYSLMNCSQSSNSSSSHAYSGAGRWNVGLINSEGKYLTAESFGCKLNASG